MKKNLVLFFDSSQKKLKTISIKNRSKSRSILPYLGVGDEEPMYSIENDVK
jgi:hypothetical protein